jgi:hypothetical protein
MNSKRLCDNCQKNFVGAFFEAYEDLINFQEYGVFPGFFSVRDQYFRTTGGSAYFVWPLKLTLVFCDECLDNESNFNSLFERALENPRLIQESLETFNQAINQNNLLIIERQEEFREMTISLLKLSEEIGELENYSARIAEIQYELLKKTEPIRAVRKKLAQTLIELMRKRIE